MKIIKRSLLVLAMSAVVVISYAASITPSSINENLAEGQTVTISRTVTLDASGPVANRVDVFFLADNTGSMGGVIGSVRNNANAILQAISGSDPRFAGIDVAFGVGSYLGDPREFSSASATDAVARSAYRLQQPITESLDDVIAGINLWRAGGGGDGPEANFFALHQVATEGGPTDGLGSTDRVFASGQVTGWRDNAAKVIVWFGDIRSHTTTVDIDEAITVLNDNKVIVAAINTSSANAGIDTVGEASTIATATQGTLTNNIRGSDATVDAILNAVESATDTIDLELQTRGDTSGLTIAFDCTSPEGCLDVTAGESRTFDMQITGNVTGSYVFETFVPTLTDAIGNDSVTVRACVSDLAARGKRNKVQLTWSDTGADQYLVYRSTTQGGPYTEVAATQSRYSTYLDTDVVNGTRYYYVVREADAAGNIACESLEASGLPSRRGRGSTPVNQAPEINSTPALSVLEDTLYTYNVEASDPDAGDTLTYSLAVAPTGMVIDSATGQIQWVPANVNVGDQQVAVQVVDDNGLFDSQLFTLSVVNVNDAPVITSSSVLFGRVGETYQYAVSASDVDFGDSLTFTLELAPVGMSIDAVTGVVTWVPAVSQQGDQNVTINVSDLAGEVVIQSYIVAVEGPNDPPTIVTTPITQAITSQLYQYDVNATDPDVGDTLTYGLLSAPSGMSINANTGVIEWTPADTQVGSQSVSVQVEDSMALTAVQNFVVNVLPANELPVINSSPVLNAVETELYSYDVDASDADGDSLTYGLIVGPAGMTVNSATGLLQWTPTNVQLGNNTVEVEVDDGRGGVDTQSFIVNVSAFVPLNRAPEISSVAITNAISSTLYTYDVSATDPDSDPIVFSLAIAPAGMTIDAASGQINWTPLEAQVGTQSVTVRATDDEGLFDEQAFDIVVAQANRAPVIDSAPVVSANEAELYTYDANANDADGDTLVYSLSIAPVGMSIDTSTGVITWTPNTAQVGNNAVELTVSDSNGGVATQSFTVVVTAAPINQLPSISSTPSTLAVETQLYTYIVDAADPEGDTLVYSLDTAPVGMTIGASTGQVQWTPNATQVGNNAVVVRVNDANSGFVTQSYTVVVTAAVVNQPPSITSAAITVGQEGLAYSYDVNATDPNGDVIVYSLNVSPAGMSIDSSSGVISWLPIVSQIGSNAIELEASDGNGGVATQSFTIIVTAAPVNQVPVINSAPVTSATVSTNYQYDVDAVDGDGDPLTYSLISAPTGMTIDSSTGLISWLPEATQVGSQTIVVRVSDGADFQEQSFAVNVSSNLLPINLSVQLSPEIANPDELVTIQVNVSGAVNPVVTVTQDATDLPVDINNRSTFSASTPGVYPLLVRVDSSDGRNQTLETFIRVRDVADTAAPDVNISSPTDDAEVMALTDVIGTVADANLFRYQLLLAPSGTSQFAEIANDTSTVVNASLGALDPSMLENGLYRLVLIAEDINGLTSQDFVDVQIRGELKPGVVQLTFTDMVVPVSGIPITIERSYDSRVKTGRDLGIGWSLDVRQGSYTNNRAPGLGWNVVAGGGFFRPPCSSAVELSSHVTEVRLNDREFYEFRTTASFFGFGSTISGGCLGQAAFVQTGGIPGATLTPLESNNVFFINGSGVLTYDLGDPDFGDPWEPERVRLRTADGREFDVDIETGITRIANRNGEQLFINDSGIVNTSGVGVQFVRDGQGRITDVIDPSGNTIGYVYDANGDLVGFRNQLGEVTRYAYYPSIPHHLQTIELPDGTIVNQFDYDANGRLSEACNGSSCSTASYDLVGRTQTNIDATGRSVTYVYDEEGNVISQTDALGNTISYVYDANGNVLEEIDPEGNVTRQTWSTNGYLLSTTEPFDSGLAAADFTTLYTYDALGNMLTSTAPNGSILQRDYDASGNLLSMQNEAGTVLTSLAYDSAGRLVSESDPYSTLNYAYDSNGNVTTLTDSSGDVANFTYDANGRPTGYDRDGLNANFTYDAMGRETNISYSDGIALSYEYGFGSDWQSAEATTVPKVERTFSATGAPTSVTQANGSEVRWEYDAAGRVTAEVGPLGGRTNYVYDAAGRLIEESDALGNSTRYELDRAGRILATISAENERQSSSYYPNGDIRTMTDGTGRTWSFEYAPNSSTVTDPLLRTTFTQVNPQGLVTQITNADGTSRSWTYITESQLTDGAEAPTSYTDEAGRRRDYTYDALGNLVSATDFAGEAATYTYSDSTPVSYTDAEGQSVSFAYDADGNVSTINFPDGASKQLSLNSENRISLVTSASGATKDLSYDALGQLTSDIRSTGENFNFTWDANGNLLSATDALGTSSYSYNLNSALAEYRTSRDESIDYVYDNVGRVTLQTIENGEGDSQQTAYEYDGAGRISKVIDPNAGETVFTYDIAGRLTSKALPNGIVTTYAYDLRDQIIRVIHENSAGTVIRSVEYIRNIGGEPNRINWQDGSYVTIAYDAALRVIDEQFFNASNVLTRRMQYEYDRVGNRTALIQDGVRTDYTYGAGHRLLSSSGAEAATYSYDVDGRVNSINRADLNASMTHNFDGQLLSTTVGSEVTDYTYDYNGRRIQSVDSSDTRNIINFAPVAGQYSNPQAILDENADFAVSYVYAGDMPMQQITSGGTRYYLTDAMGSVIGVADESGNLLGSVKYDAFGRQFEQTGDMSLASDAGGDFRYHGQWQDSSTGLYHVRARDYDSNTGRFLSNDPAEPDLLEPESLNRYLFANANPYLFTDPTGRFSLVSVNVSISIQGTLRGIAINIARDYFIDKARSVAGSLVLSALKNFTALNSFNPWAYLNPNGGPGFAQIGRIWEAKVQSFICEILPGAAREIVWFEVSVNAGFASTDGFGCGGGNTRVVPGSSRPDFVLSKTPPSDLGKRGARRLKAYLIGEAKWRLKTFYNQYVKNSRKRRQLEQISIFASRRVYARTAVFLALLDGTDRGEKLALTSLLQRVAVSRGVLPVMVSAQ